MLNHIIRGSEMRQVLRMVAHVTTPAGNNRVGVSWANAIVRSKYSFGTGVAPGTSVLISGDGTDGTISAAELAQLAAGTVYEFLWDCPLPEVWNSLTTQQKKDHISTQRAIAAADKAALLTKELDYFGFTFDT